MGRLIVFEGIDGSGKSTQFNLLCAELKKRNIDFINLVFPQYSEESSALIRMYLGGEFGSHPGDVNAYAASCFFAVDRYASYKKNWGKYYEDGGIIITDRYTTSNAVHQASKLKPDKRHSFFDWLYDFEYNKLGMPAPDSVIFLDTTVEAAARQRRCREESNGSKADIHEKDNIYLEACCSAAKDAAAYYRWSTINCTENGETRRMEDIHSEIMNLPSIYEMLF